MKKRFYIAIISVLVIVIVSTAFIPFNNKNEIDKGKSYTNITHNHPEAGYIEEIGN